MPIQSTFSSSEPSRAAHRDEGVAPAVEPAKANDGRIAPDVVRASLPTHESTNRVGLRILRLPELMRRVGLQRSSIYARLSPKSKYYDARFPRPVLLHAARGTSSCHLRRRSAVGWIEAEVDQYLLCLRAVATQG